MYSDQIGNTATTNELGAHGVARCFWCNHDHVKVSTRYNLVVQDGETMGKRQRGALLEVRFNVVTIDCSLILIGCQDHDHICCSNRFADWQNGQTFGLSLTSRGRTRTQANHYAYARILEVQGMRMTLRTITDDGDFLALDQRQVTIFVVINLHGKLSKKIKSDKKSDKGYQASGTDMPRGPRAIPSAPDRTISTTGISPRAARNASSLCPGPTIWMV